MLKHQNIAPIQ